MTRSAVVALLGLASTVGLVPATGAPGVVPLTLPSGKVLKVEVMVEDADRALGLMFRSSLPADRGMLFVFERADFHGIWMKNCRFPIDILWLDADKRIVHVQEAAPPCPKELQDRCPVYSPLRKAAYVVELNAGQARREGAVVGGAVSFPARP